MSEPDLRKLERQSDGPMVTLGGRHREFTGTTPLQPGAGGVSTTPAELKMARDVLRMATMAPAGRLVHNNPEAVFAGVHALLKTAAKRHRRYWGRNRG